MKAEEIRNLFKLLGFEGRSITEIWYNDDGKLKKKLNEYDQTLAQKIESLIRWETDIGKKVLGEVRAFIKEKIDMTKKVNEDSFQLGIHHFELTIIDFNELKINNKSLNDYFYENVPHSRKYTGWNDLAGIPLENISISNAIIRNALFSDSNFSNSVLQSIRFEKCNLNNCSFKNCHVSALRIEAAHGSYSNCDWSGSLVNAIEISSKMFGGNSNLNKISYFELIKRSLCINKKNKSYTDFVFCQLINDDTDLQFKDIFNYINWYQNTMNLFNSASKEKNPVKKFSKVIMNFAITITTMNWHSFTATVVTGAFIIFIFSLSYWYWNDIYTDITNYERALNFSIQIFTSLGYGDIKPDLKKSNIGLWVVSLETALGYFG
ncbi:MAG: pentapeptide repeat-containing protein [Leptospiraceae bacterium]|nr:pentapeptide repeat-containing protein [Leptospiraceae bacterium]